MAFTAYSFNPGVPSNIYLPTNGSRNSFTSTFVNGLTGGTATLDKCYDKYGLAWKWSTFESTPSAINALSSTQTIYPSSWSTLQCFLCAGSLNSGNPGTYPKKWTYELPLSSELFNPSFAACSAASILWTLSSINWSVQQIIPLSVSNSFNFELRLNDNEKLIYTAASHQNTIFTLNAQLSVNCLDLTTIPQTASQSFISETYSFTAVAPPQLDIYTANRYVLTGVNVAFENLITNTSIITALDIDFDDGKTLHVSGDKINQKYFSTNYDTIGFKTIKITAYANYGREPYFITSYPNLIRVFSNYDEVSPREYRIASDALTLPYQNQPTVGSNDWAVEDNINVCFNQFYENLEYLNSRSKIYSDTYSEYFGYLGSLPTLINGVTSTPIWTWEDADCLNTSLDYSVTWRKLLSSDSVVDTGEFVPYGTWENQECSSGLFSFNCSERGSLTGTDCVEWNWYSRRSDVANNIITWAETKAGTEYSKKWRFELCPGSQLPICDTGTWNVNISGIGDYYPEFAVPAIQSRCVYYGIASKENKIYLAQKTQVRLLSSNKDATFYSSRSSFDDILDFSSVEAIRLNSENKIFVLDSILSQVAVYNFREIGRNGEWQLFVNWGGVGSNNYKFLNPQDIHIDQLDNVWVADTGNYSVKHYSGTGTWLKTIKDDSLKLNAPLSICVDSQKQLHVLTTKEIRVYSYEGEFLFSYDYSSYVTEITPKRINSSYNREVIYLALNKQVLKFFRNGVFAGYIIKEKNNVFNITDVFHDEYRNLLITTNDKVMKYSDLMTQIQLKGKLSDSYWDLEDLYIHKEEYIQNWVYNKSFQRLWDNIETFRNSLLFTQQGCKAYKGPIYTKKQIILGQNEIVTSTAINRILGYLWTNFNSLADYFNPNCKD